MNATGWQILLCYFQGKDIDIQIHGAYIEQMSMLASCLKPTAGIPSVGQRKQVQPEQARSPQQLNESEFTANYLFQ